MSYPAEPPPVPKISSATQSITPERTTTPMQDPSTPTSSEESAMLDAFRGGAPVPVGNPEAAAAAQELADATTKVVEDGMAKFGRGSEAVYGNRRGSWLQ